MKRFTVCIMVFLMMLWFSGNSVHAKTPNRLQVNSAEIIIDMEESPPIFDFYIVGLNFGDAPQVSLGNYTLEVTSNDNEHIVATVQGDITPGTYRLSVARSGVDFSHPKKADSLDVTISDANSDQESRDLEEPSGVLKREDIYEIQETFDIDSEGDFPIKCSCRDENDIALNGGYEISPPIDYPDHELTILKSNMYYSDEAYDYYELVVNNPITLHTPLGIQEIRIDVYLRCINIPNE